jgi:hypothetical protein
MTFRTEKRNAICYHCVIPYLEYEKEYLILETTPLPIDIIPLILQYSINYQEQLIEAEAESDVLGSEFQEAPLSLPGGGSIPKPSAL